MPPPMHITLSMSQSLLFPISPQIQLSFIYQEKCPLILDRIFAGLPCWETVRAASMPCQYRTSTQPKLLALLGPHEAQ